MMPDIKSTQITQPVQSSDDQMMQPAYMSPKITVYEEKELLKTVTVLGGSLTAT